MPIGDTAEYISETEWKRGNSDVTPPPRVSVPRVLGRATHPSKPHSDRYHLGRTTPYPTPGITRIAQYGHCLYTPPIVGFSRWTPSRPPPGKGTLSVILLTHAHLAPDTWASHGHVVFYSYYKLQCYQVKQTSESLWRQSRHVCLKCLSLLSRASVLTWAMHRICDPPMQMYNSIN